MGGENIFLFDTHCDTLTTARAAGLDLVNTVTQISPDRLPGHRWCQCFAIWLEDGLAGSAATAYYDSHQSYFREQLARYPGLVRQAVTASQIQAVLEAGQVAAVLTVENGATLGGSLDTLERMARDGVRMLTLTWNGANELAGGQLAPGGFTDFGRAAVGRMEQLGIVADVSHLCEQAFWELEGFASRPYLASHSNCRALREHGRNLTDRQIAAIARRGGLVSVTFYAPFLTDAPDGDFDCLLRHLERILRVGGEGAAALGSDFDGGVASAHFTGTQAMPALYERLCGYFGEKLADRILGQNALDFFRRYDAALPCQGKEE